MVKDTITLDHWRDKFNSVGADIFEIIKNGIIIAALDRSEEFMMQRGQIAEQLFTGLEEMVEVDVKCSCKGRSGDIEGFTSKESIVSSTTNDRDETDLNNVSRYTFDEVQALTEETDDEENKLVKEVFRIKGVLSNNQDESEEIMFDALRMLQLMPIDIQTLKVTEIGLTVDRLKGHKSRQIRHLAQTLADGWMNMVNRDWFESTDDVAEGSYDYLNSSSIFEEGLPFSPLDEEAFLATETSAIDFLQFFGDVYYGGNPLEDIESYEKHETERNQLQHCENIPSQKQQSPINTNVLKKEDSEQEKKQEASIEQTMPEKTVSDPTRHVILNSKDKLYNESRMELGFQQDKPKNSDEVLRMKLEASKKSLRESYKQDENDSLENLKSHEKHETERNQLQHCENIPSQKQRSPIKTNVLKKEDNGQEKKQEAAIEQTMPEKNVLDPTRPVILNSEDKLDNESRMQLGFQQDKPKNSDVLRMKLEASKKRLRESYKQDENDPLENLKSHEKHETERNQLQHCENIPSQKQQSPIETKVLKKEDNGQEKKQEAATEETMPEKTVSDPTRPLILNSKDKLYNESKVQLGFQQDKPKNSDEVLRMKLEASKKRIRESYKQDENAKKQRKTRALHFLDIPKQEVRRRDPPTRNRKSGPRLWVNRRH